MAAPFVRYSILHLAFAFIHANATGAPTMTEQRKYFVRGDEICYISREDDQSFGMPIPIARFFGDESDKVELEACLAAQPAPQRMREHDESLRKDAERYRWLREYGYGLPKIGVKLDTAIDAAMQTQAPTGA
jgi:hypothetical protein